MPSSLTLDDIKRLQLDMLKAVARVCDRHGLRYFLAYGTLLGAVRHGGFIPWDDDIDIILPRPDYDRLVELARTEFPPYYRFVDYRMNWRVDLNIGKVIDTRTVLIPESRFGEEVTLGVYIDLFPLDGVPAGKWAKKWHFWTTWVLNRLLVVGTMDRARRRPFHQRLIIEIVQLFMRKSTIIHCHRLLESLSRRYGWDETDEICSFVGGGDIGEIMPKKWLGSGKLMRFEDAEFVVPIEYDKYLRSIYGDYMQLPPPDKRHGHHRFRAWWAPRDTGGLVNDNEK